MYLTLEQMYYYSQSLITYKNINLEGLKGLKSLKAIYKLPDDDQF